MSRYCFGAPGPAREPRPIEAQEDGSSRPDRSTEPVARPAPGIDREQSPDSPEQASTHHRPPGFLARLGKRLKDGSVDDETRKLQERVMARLGEALKRETARKVSSGQIDLAPGLVD